MGRVSRKRKNWSIYRGLSNGELERQVKSLQGQLAEALRQERRREAQEIESQLADVRYEVRKREELRAALVARLREGSVA